MITGGKEFINNVFYWKKLSSGCTSIDRVLNGGFPIYGINEVKYTSIFRFQVNLLQVKLSCVYN